MFKQLLLDWDFSPTAAKYTALFFNIGIVILCSYLSFYVVRMVFSNMLIRVTRKNNLQFGDFAVKYKVFNTVAYLIVSTILFQYAIEPIFKDFSDYHAYAQRVMRAYMTVMAAIILIRSCNGLKAYLEPIERYHDKPLHSFFHIAKISIWILGGIIILSTLINKSPLYLFGLFGGASVVLIFAFKDPILGFLAVIQLSYNDMVHIGDWVSVDQYYADGEVIEINLTTIKVQNWDNTITTIPTYAFVSGSFKNWQGMLKSGGRRIKRSILINKNSIDFCSEEMLSRFEKIELIAPYIKQKREELKRYNAAHGHDISLKINGRHLTNIGCYRVYVEKYLENEPLINTSMPYMARQLDATEKGLPVEVYAFSRLKELKHYENVVSDIFDHLYAATYFFNLEVVQDITGKDIKLQLSKLLPPT